MKREDKQAVKLWQGRLDEASSAYAEEQKKMDRRERQYGGEREIFPLTENDYKKGKGKRRKTSHVWNITAENIEAMIDSTIPSPKVTPVRKEDERLARIIENMLRNEIDRLQTELINDEGERTAKKQGGVGLMVEWDQTAKSHTTTGSNSLRVVHPKRIIPQDGIKNVEEMDYFFLLIPMSKKTVERRWGVSVKNESEENPEVREEGAGNSEELVTVKFAIYRNEEGGVGTFIWVNDTPLSNMEDAQARRMRRCKKCGATEVENAIMLEEPSINGEFPEGSPERKPRKDECAYCGSRSWESVKEEHREMTIEDLMRVGAPKKVIDQLAAKYAPEPVMMPTADPMMAAVIDAEDKEMTAEQGKIEVPYYEPNLYPLVMWMNVSSYSTFLGESDCDKVMDQQNTLNRMSQKILDRLVKAGTKITAPSDAHINMDSEDSEIIRITKMTDMALIKEFQFSGNLQYEFSMIQQVYSESQRILGITESFLGRADPTAQSGKAKQFAAAQTAGRMESKRVLKKAAWADVYERLFKNMLAYADERRPVHFENEQGQVDYEEFNAWDFLQIDDAGELYWNDQFLFSCDDASGLAANREAMWQETTAHLQSGAFGNPGEINTLLIYWAAMERLHYPGAGEIKKLLEEQQQRQMQQQAVMLQMQQAQQMQQPAIMNMTGGRPV